MSRAIVGGRDRPRPGDQGFAPAVLPLCQASNSSPALLALELEERDRSTLEFRADDVRLKPKAVPTIGRDLSRKPAPIVMTLLREIMGGPPCFRQGARENKNATGPSPMICDP